MYELSTMTNDGCREDALLAFKRKQDKIYMKNLGPLNEDDTRDNEHIGLAQFITINSHQLRQPIYAMNLYLATINTFDLPEAVLAVFENLKQCAGFLDEMFLSLLDLASLHANPTERKSEQFPVVSALLQVKNEYIDEAEKRGVEFCVVPNSAWVKGDLTLVKKILCMLTADAIRFSDPARLLIGCRRKGRNLRIEIYNYGSRSAHSRAVFDGAKSKRFLDDRLDRFDNSNVGFALARELGQQLAAPLMCRSISGRGSVIAFDLPLLPSRAVMPLLPVPPESDNALAHKFVAVVDDDEDVLNAMRMLLGRWQCSVVTACSCEEVLERLGTYHQAPDVLICDYRLGPRENGLDVIRILRAEFNQNIPALLITGETLSALVQEARAMGIYALHKPVQAEKLQHALQHALIAFPA